MADGGHFNRCRWNYSAADFWVEKNLVRNFQIGDYGLQNFIDFALGHDQSQFLELDDDVIFGAALPGSLNVERTLVGILRQILGSGGIDHDLGKFRVVARAEIVAPDAGLSLQPGILSLRSAGV